MLVSDRIGSVLRLVVAMFSVYSLSEVHQHRYIFHAFKSDLAVGLDGDDVNSINVMCGATGRQLEELEWFLKGRDS